MIQKNPPGDTLFVPQTKNSRQLSSASEVIIRNHFLFAVTPISRTKAWLPSVESTLTIGEYFHRALVSLAAGGSRIDCPELTGHGKDGLPLKGKHLHNHIYPLDLNEDGLIDHVLLHCPMGFGEKAIRAIQSLKVVQCGSREKSLHCHLSANKPLVQCQSKRNLFFKSVLSGSSSWRSFSPFVLSRFLKKNGRNSFENQIQSELEMRGIHASCQIKVLPELAQSIKKFRIERKYGQKPPQRHCFAIRLTFDKEVIGPISLGYGSHFGLGLFVGEGS